MSRPDRVPRDLVDAAAVHAAPDAIVLALGPLAASPLDEQATSRMKAALEGAESPAVRRAIRRLTRSGEPRPPLQAVPSLTSDRTAGLRSRTPQPPRRPCQFLTPLLTPGGAA